jgi:hypothetical protein
MRITSINVKGGLEMASCFDARENICAYIDNELDADERRSFDEHIRDCMDCRRELEEMKRIIRLCNELPQLELPPGFKAELHEKLLAVQGGQDKIVKYGRRNKTFFLTRKFASIAAGVLLIFLAGGIIRLSLYSPKMTAKNSEQYTDMAAAEAPAERAMPAAGVEEQQIGVQEDGKAYTTKSITNQSVAGNETESLDTNRSAATSDREGAQSFEPEMDEKEIAFNRISTITILGEDPMASAEIVRMLAFENSGEIAADENEQAGAANFRLPGAMAAKQYTGGGSDAGETFVEPMMFIFPCTNYDTFIEAVNKSFGEANVQVGALVTEDMTDALNELISESVRIDNSIQELQKGNNTGNSEIDELKKEKGIVDEQIETIRLGSDFVTVTVNINAK